METLQRREQGRSRLIKIIQNADKSDSDTERWEQRTSHKQKRDDDRLLRQLRDRSNLAEEDREKSRGIKRIDLIAGAGRRGRGQASRGCLCDPTLGSAAIAARSPPTNGLPT
uniref:Uncharacterized protein n=1 Tax=Noccaea caerulescens TaxID=107243 RepID=A0A1J3ENV2_NOCCA